MNVIAWNPWKEMESVSGRMHRLFGDDFLPSRGYAAQSGLKALKPAVDIYDHDDKIVFLVELPGMNKDDIHVDLENEILILKGERAHDQASDKDHFYRREIVYGVFERSFSLPEGCDPEKVKADYKDGFLKIEVSKPEETKPRKIAVH